MFFRVYAAALVLRMESTVTDEILTTTRMRIEGMDCASCAIKIENALKRVAQVAEVNVSVPTGTVTVKHDCADAETLPKRVTGLGYKVLQIDHTTGDGVPPPKVVDSDHTKHTHGDGPIDRFWWRSNKGLLTIATGGALALAFLLGKTFPEAERWVFLPAMLVGLIPITRRAVAAAGAGTPFSIEMLMTVAAVGAVFIGAAEEAAAVVFLFLIGELLEGVAASRARASIQSLTELIPATARLEENGQVREVKASTLEVGSTIQVRPGDRVPADGTIISGVSSIDEAPVSGESVPIQKGPGEAIFAGTINGEGLLIVKVTAAAIDNTIARVVRLVEEAQESKAPTERFIDRFSHYYTPAVVLVALLIAVFPPLALGGLWKEWIYKGLAILLIGCPCALVISTPAAIAASLAAGARRGLLMKGGGVLEQVGKITIACFDKTGTLTAGKPRITDIVSFGSSDTDVLRYAAALEAGSSHPLALAILAKASDENLSLPRALNASALSGRGIRATVDGKEIFIGSPQAANDISKLSSEQEARISALNSEGKTVSVVQIDKVLAGAIAMRDEPRADAKIGLSALASLNVRALMLTGDNQRTATAIGNQLGIEVRAQLLPEDKQKIVRELKSEGFWVAKIGDGINDAPALAAADVGIAMGGGTDVALETADAAILHARVTDVAAMVELSRRTMSNIKQNIVVALGLKAVFLVTTIVGVTGLWPAILADTGATILVTLNALRLLKPAV